MRPEIFQILCMEIRQICLMENSFPRLFIPFFPINVEYRGVSLLSPPGSVHNKVSHLGLRTNGLMLFVSEMISQKNWFRHGIFVRC